MTARKSTPPPLHRSERRAQKKQDQLPALVQSGTTAWEAAKLMKAGKSAPEIAKRLSISENHLAQVMKDALREIQDQVASILVNWTAVSISREEEILSRLWERMFDEDGRPNPDIIGLVQNAILMEQKIMAFSMVRSGDKQGGMVQNVTIVNNHDPNGLYMEAQRALNMNMRTEEGEFRDEMVSSLDDVMPGGIVYLPKAKHDE